MQTSAATYSEWTGFCSLLKKETDRFWKVAGQTIFSPLVNALLYLVVFGLSFSSLLKNQQGFSYLEFLIPGLVALSALNNALQNSASSIMVSKFHGDLQDLRLIPLSPFSISTAYVIASIIRGAAVGFIVLVVGEVVYVCKTGHALPIAHPLDLIAFIVFGGAIFGNIGIFTGFICKSFDQVHSITQFVILPLIYLGGVFFSLEILHPAIRALAYFNPLLYLINGIRWGILGRADMGSLSCFLVSILFVGISSSLAWYSVRYGSYQRF
jgi:ABC-2 type transport system permease protein